MLGVALVLILLVVFGVRSCRDSRRERALTDYVQDSEALAQESTQLSTSLLGLLGEPGEGSPVEIQSTVNGLAVQAARLADRPGAVEPPGELAESHRQLADLLALRRDGVAGVAKQLPTAFADEGRQAAASAIAEDMRLFLASDVLYARRFRPALERSLAAEGLGASAGVSAAPFLPDLSWLRAETVATRMGRLRSSAEEGAATPGVHGVGLGAVTVTPSGARLAEGGPVQVPADQELGFAVEVQNEGESEETVAVRLMISGPEGTEPIDRDKELDSPLPPGEAETVSVPLADTPPTGVPATVEVEIVPVPGESEKDDNRASFPVSFTPGASGP